MATMLRTGDPRLLDRPKAGESTGAGPSAAAFAATCAATAAAGFRHGCDILAELINVFFTAAALLSNVALAASLGFMIAGQVAG